MSRATARQNTARQSAPRRNGSSTASKRPNLRLVDPRVAAARTRRRRILSSSMVVLVVGMFLVAYAQARLVEGQHELDQLRTQVAEARKTRARLANEVVLASSPESITNRARDLGMVRAVDPQYVVAVGSVASAPIEASADEALPRGDGAVSGDQGSLPNQTVQLDLDDATEASSP